MEAGLVEFAERKSGRGRPRIAVVARRPPRRETRLEEMEGGGKGSASELDGVNATIISFSHSALDWRGNGLTQPHQVKYLRLYRTYGIHGCQDTACV
jgi:hypothetical protein